MQLTEAATLDRKSGGAEGSAVTLNHKLILRLKKAITEPIGRC
jgi:hypothetical protein